MLFALLAMNRPAAQPNVVYVRRHGNLVIRRASCG